MSGDAQKPRWWDGGWVTALLLVCVVYVAYNTYQAVQTSNQKASERDELVDTLSQARLEQQRLRALLVYYNTPTFQELELRRSLLLTREGERVFRLPERHGARRPGDVALVRETQKPKASDSSFGLWRWISYLRGEIR